MTSTQAILQQQIAEEERRKAMKKSFFQKALPFAPLAAAAGAIFPPLMAAGPAAGAAGATAGAAGGAAAGAGAATASGGLAELGPALGRGMAASQMAQSLTSPFIKQAPGSEGAAFGMANEYMGIGGQPTIGYRRRRMV